MSNRMEQQPREGWNGIGEWEKVGRERGEIETKGGKGSQNGAHYAGYH